MGVVKETECIGCGRWGRAWSDTNYIYECYNCGQKRLKYTIIGATQQVWWIRFLYWCVGKKQTSLNTDNYEELIKEL